jgi:phthiocerol/phenolphthiocerol synthesis type-I polyketide synthase E
MDAPRRWNDTSAGLRRWHVLALSAESEAELDELAERVVRDLQSDVGDIRDVPYALHRSPRRAAHRRAVVCSDREGAVAALRSSDPALVWTGAPPPGVQHVAFMFPGGGSQHFRMAADLYAEETVFRQEFDRCARLLLDAGVSDIRDVAYGSGGRSTVDAAAIDRPLFALPSLFATNYALAHVWMSWGVFPSALIGHSLGEYVAACVARSLSLAEALTLVAARARLIDTLPTGAMLSVDARESELCPVVPPGVSIAAINGRSRCVVAGLPQAVDRLEQRLTAAGVTVRRLRLAAAAHSSLVEPILGEFAAIAGRVRMRPPKIPWVSNVTGTWMTGDEDVTYWVDHLRRPVRFAEGLDLLLKSSNAHMLEVGPSHVLTTLARQHAGPQHEGLILASLPHPQQRKPDGLVVMTALARMWAAGVKVDWDAFYRSGARGVAASVETS